MELTLNQEKVLIFLKEHKKRFPNAPFVSPTEIGNLVGGINRNGIMRHSSWASPICKQLVSLGLAERNDYGHYSSV